MFQFLIPAISALTGLFKGGSKANNVAQGVGTVLGGLASGSAAGRQAEAGANAVQDTQATQQYIAQQQALINALQGASSEQTNQGQLDLQRRNYTLQAPNARAGTAVRGDILSRAQDFKLQGVPSHIPRMTGSGGFTPSMLSPQSRALGASMTQNALSQQQAGDQFAPMTQQNWQGAVLPKPGLTQQPQANAWDKALGVAGQGAQIAGAIGGGVQAANQQTQTQQIIAKLLEELNKAKPLDSNPVPAMGIPTYPGATPPLM